METIVQRLCANLVEMGNSVHVLTTDPTRSLPRRQTIDGIIVERFPSLAPSGTAYFSPSLGSFLRKNRTSYDIINVHGYHSLIALHTAMACKRDNLVIHSYYHGSGKTALTNALLRAYKPFGKWVINSASRVISLSKYERGLLMRDFGITQEKVAIVSPGLDSFFYPEVARDTYSVLTVARLEKYKGVEEVVRSLPYLGPRYHLTIVGRGTYGPQIRELVHSLGLNSRVEIYDSLPREILNKKFSEAGVFVLLSRSESFGIAVMEALAAGTPCVVLNSAALSEWVDNENCFGIDSPPHPRDVAHLISESAGRRIHGEKFKSWMKMAEEVVEQYNAVLSKSSTK